MTSLLALLADSALTWASLGDSMLVASTTVAFHTQGLPPVFPRFSVAGTRSASADVYGVGVGRVLLEQRGLVGARGFR